MQQEADTRPVVASRLEVDIRPEAGSLPESSSLLGLARARLVGGPRVAAHRPGGQQKAEMRQLGTRPLEPWRVLPAAFRRSRTGRRQKVQGASSNPRLRRLRTVVLYESRARVAAGLP